MTKKYIKTRLCVYVHVLELVTYHLLFQDYEEDLNSSNDTIIYSPTKSSHDEPVMTTPTETQPTPGVSLMECPLCLSFYPHYAIELHASECRGDDTYQCNAATEAVVID